MQKTGAAHGVHLGLTTRGKQRALDRQAGDEEMIVIDAAIRWLAFWSSHGHGVCPSQ